MMPCWLLWKKINDLIKAAIIAQHDNEKGKKANSPVNDKRKKKKQTNGGGALQSKSNRNSQKSKTNRSSSLKKNKTPNSNNQSNSHGRRRKGKVGAVVSNTARTDQQGKGRDPTTGMTTLRFERAIFGFYLRIARRLQVKRAKA